MGRFDKVSQLNSIVFDIDFRKFIIRFKTEDYRYRYKDRNRALISLANMDVISVLERFSTNQKMSNIDVSFLVPTKTGLKKSIMDATEQVRYHLREAKIHDYDAQPQGKGAKVKLPAIIYSKGEIVPVECSLYRPKAKDGDPRIWFYGLKKYALPTDLLALIESNKGLVVINCSQSNLEELLELNNRLFWDNIKPPLTSISDTALELLDKMKAVAGQGYIKTLRSGTTGVGYTLETLLGIAANSSRKPDYKGIEIKSYRAGHGRSNKRDLFACVPNWSLSNLKSSRDIVYKRGRYKEERSRWQLYHTIDAVKANSYDLLLEVNDDYLHQGHVGNGKFERDVTWEMAELVRRLSNKHSQTFWVAASTRGRGESEEFQYMSVNYTVEPDLLKMQVMLEAGEITVDYLIFELSEGSVRDKGYKFKIKPKYLELLFKSKGRFELV